MKLDPDVVWRRRMVLLIWFILFLTIGFTLGGCNTVKGLSEDLYNVAEGIQNEMSTTRNIN